MGVIFVMQDRDRWTKCITFLPYPSELAVGY